MTVLHDLMEVGAAIYLVSLLAMVILLVPEVLRRRQQRREFHFSEADVVEISRYLADPDGDAA